MIRSELSFVPVVLRHGNPYPLAFCPLKTRSSMDEQAERELKMQQRELLGVLKESVQGNREFAATLDRMRSQNAEFQKTFVDRLTSIENRLSTIESRLGAVLRPNALPAP